MNINTENDLGVVFRKMLGHYTVHTHGREIDCELSSLLRKQLIYPIADPTSMRHRVMAVNEIEHVDPVAVGDEVVLIGRQGSEEITIYEYAKKLDTIVATIGAMISPRVPRRYVDATPSGRSE